MSTDDPPAVNGRTMYGKAYMPADSHDTADPQPTSYIPLDPSKYLAGEGGIHREPVNPHTPPTHPLTHLPIPSPSSPPSPPSPPFSHSPPSAPSFRSWPSPV